MVLEWQDGNGKRRDTETSVASENPKGYSVLGNGTVT